MLCRKAVSIATKALTTEPQSETRDLRTTAQARHPHWGRGRLPPARFAAGGVARLTELNKTALRRQTADLNSVITSVRSYASNVVGRILANPDGTTKAQLRIRPRRDPDPGDAVARARAGIGAQQENIAYRFVSDFPFQNRAPHQLDKFEKDAHHRLSSSAASPPASPPSPASSTPPGSNPGCRGGACPSPKCCG